MYQIFITSVGSKGGPNSFNFMQFLRKFGKIVCWRPPTPRNLRPLLGEILDPPPITVHLQNFNDF